MVSVGAPIIQDTNQRYKEVIVHVIRENKAEMYQFYNSMPEVYEFYYKKPHEYVNAKLAVYGRAQNNKLVPIQAATQIISTMLRNGISDHFSVHL